MPYPVEYIFELAKEWNWALIALVAGGLGAIAATWNRLLDLIDQWILKTVRSGHRGTLWILGNAVRFPIFRIMTNRSSWARLPLFVLREQTDETLSRKRFRYEGMWLLKLPPFAYLQIFLFVQVRDFSIQRRPLAISPLEVVNRETGKVIRVEGNITIRTMPGGRHANISQVRVDNPDGIAHMHAQKVIAKIVANEPFELLSNPLAFNESVLKACGYIPKVCGQEVVESCLATFAPNVGQLQKDGLQAIAKASEKSV